MVGRPWSWSGALVLGAWLGCSPSEFLCETDAACEQAGTQGVCQSNGYCSFPDDTCMSGQRYGEHAGGTLAGTCVDAEASTSGSEEGPEPTGAGTSDTTTGSGTTLALDESGTTSEPSTDGGTTGSESVVCWFDGFDDGTIDPDWCQVDSPGLTLSEHDGMLWVDLDPNQWDGLSGQVGEIASCVPRPLLGHIATTHVEQVPQASSFTLAFFEVGNDAHRLGVGTVDGMLYVFINEDGVYSDTAWQPYDNTAHHFWRVRGTPEGLVAEASPDEVTWEHLHTHELDLTGEEGYVWLGVWSDTLPLEPDDAAVDTLELCWVEG